jgi:hypothetical protein
MWCELQLSTCVPQLRYACTELTAVPLALLPSPLSPLHSPLPLRAETHPHLLTRHRMLRQSEGHLTALFNSCWAHIAIE